MVEWKKVNWDKIYIAVVLFLIALDFSRSVYAPSNKIHTDHRFHMVKFELFKKYGFAQYAELGEVPLKLLLPAFLLPFLLLAWVLPAKSAYLLTYFLLVALAYFGSRRILKKNKLAPVLAILFPASAFVYFTMGRLLELAGHLPLLVLAAYLEEGDSRYITTLLFMLGATSHLPTLLFYFPFLLLKLHQQHKMNHLIYWTLFAIPWLGVYLPASMGGMGWQISRLEKIVPEILHVFQAQGGAWLIYGLCAFFVALLVALLFLGTDGWFALPSFLLTTASTMMVLNGNMLPAKIPGFNQILPVTGLPLFAYLLMKKSRKAWRVLAWGSLFILAVPIPWQGPFSQDYPVLDWVNGSYTVAKFPIENADMKYTVMTYLAHKNMPTPLCSTWEYADPGWWRYSPKNCSEIMSATDYIIFPKRDQWAKKCGESREGDYIIVVKTG